MFIAMEKFISKAQVAAFQEGPLVVVQSLTPFFSARTLCQLSLARNQV